MSNRQRQNYFAPFLAGILAWLVPGAGHVYIRRTLRGIIICICINGLFWTGVALGGIFTVEPLKQRWWFAAQMCAGVSGVTAWYRQEQYRRAVTEGFDDPQLRTPTPPPWTRQDKNLPEKWWYTYNQALVKEGISLSYPGETVALAYTGVAGMLNLMCIFDAVMLAAMGQFGEPERNERRKKT
ncbi:MAG: DUF6677 family protein [Planctomycetota bacterium]|nr:DUF6677 family protein [Planctomycetota bacterium]